MALFHSRMAEHFVEKWIGGSRRRETYVSGFSGCIRQEGMRCANGRGVYERIWVASNFRKASFQGLKPFATANCHRLTANSLAHPSTDFRCSFSPSIRASASSRTSGSRPGVHHRLQRFSACVRPTTPQAILASPGRFPCESHLIVRRILIYRTPPKRGEGPRGLPARGFAASAWRIRHQRQRPGESG
jgi:hypothetical protein